MDNLEQALSQTVLKERLMAILAKEPRSLAKISRKMDIDRNTFHNFWHGSFNTSLKNLLIIKNYIDCEEQRLGILQK